MVSLHDAADVTHAGGMRATRAFPTRMHSHLDPFVLFERFHIGADQGFPSHRHAGFEICTYMLEGGMAHDDSLDNAGTARAGEAMRISAGRGIEHSEFPADGPCTGLQLWLNLSRERKEIEPSYADATAEQLPTAESDGATVTTVVGEGSPLAFETPMTYRDVALAENASWSWDRPSDWAGFCFVLSRSGTVDDASLEPGQFCTVAGGDDTVTLSSDDGCRVIAVAGRPHDEPIHQRGPIVA
jgi:redox-sensitive bicupin YhaK (pirin superfamily)